MRYVGFFAGALLAIVLFALWFLETIVRGGTCGPAEGGGSCAAGLLSWGLLGGALLAIGTSIALAIRVLRQR
jgi:hypothetical protein